MYPIHHNPNWAVSPGGLTIDLYSSHQELISPILIIGGIHGDEPEGVHLAEATLDWLKSHETNVHWVLIPCLNPDGYKSHSRTNSNGVDLNRNYPAKSWSPEFKNKRYNPGPHGGSEPEITALTKLIHSIHPRLIIHYHSWNPCIVCTGSPARPYAKILSESSSYEIVDTIGYDTPGSLSQYAWHDHQIPVICIEETEGVSKEQVWKNLGPGIIKIFTEGPLYKGPLHKGSIYKSPIYQGPSC